MNSFIILEGIQIAGFAILFFTPFEKKRIRARWAKLVFILSSLIGIAKGSIGLAWDLGWFSVSSKGGQVLQSYLSMTGGLLLGFLFSLIFSGQLTGKKQPPNTALEPTGTAPVSSTNR
jgi:hypothetical protein